MFRSLGTRNYRIWFLAGLMSNMGTWIQTTALNWFVLRDLTDGDATAVGIALGLQFAPQLLLVPLTGWLPDRFDRRKLIIVVQSLLLVVVVLLALIVLSGAMTVPLMYVLSFIFGVLNAFDIPARQVFVADLVSQENVPNAIALNSASYNLGRMIGPAAAGALLVAVGAGWAFMSNAMSYIAIIVALLMMRRSELVPRQRPAIPPRIWGGVRYVAKRRDLIFVLVTMFIIGALSINTPLTSSVMVSYFDGDAADFGVVNSLVAVGSLAGALIAAASSRARLSVLVGAWAIMAISALGAALAPSVLWYTAALTVMGFSIILALATANGYVQSTTHPVVRGRVLAIYMAILMGASTVGSPLLGLASDMAGPRWSVALGAIAAAVTTAVGIAWLMWGPKDSEPVESTPTTEPPMPEQLSDTMVSGSALKWPDHTGDSSGGTPPTSQDAPPPGDDPSAGPEASPPRVP